MPRFSKTFIDGQRVSLSGKNGYVRIWAPGHPVAYKDGMVLLHRKVWYDAYGEIPKGYQVHHKDHDRRNNDLGNLELLSNGEHQLTHHSQVGSKRKNQYGEFEILSPEERRERERARSYHRNVMGLKTPLPSNWRELYPRKIGLKP